MGKNYYILGVEVMARWLNMGYFSEGHTGWRAGRGPEFDYQYPHSSSQLLTPVSGNMEASSDLL